jgi:hypothetical protein
MSGFYKRNLIKQNVVEKWLASLAYLEFGEVPGSNPNPETRYTKAFVVFFSSSR